MKRNKNRSSGRPPKCAAIIAAAGLSERMAGEDKLFTEICGVPVLAHTLAVFQRCELIGEIVVVAREDSIDPVSELCAKYGIDKATKVMVGGKTRLESALIGALAVSDKAELIAIHDGARPCVSETIIENAINAAANCHASAPAVKVSSTIKRANDGLVTETVDRENLYEMQTPQVFTAELIKAALTNAMNKSIEVTDDCMAVEILGFPVRLTEGSGSNIKITLPEDLIIAKAILEASRGEVF